MSKQSLPFGLTTVGLSLFLSACSLAPQYERPDPSVADQFPAQTRTSYDASKGEFSQRQVDAASFGLGSQSSEATPWQGFFRDPQLKALVGLALQNNRNLQVAISRMEQAEAVWGVQRGQMYPQLGASARGARQAAPNPASATASNVISSQYSAGVAVTAFELDIFGRLRNLSEAAFQQYLASAEGTRAVQIALVADTAIQFYRLRMVEVMLELTRETYQVRKKTYDLVSARFRSGISSERDAVQAKALVDASAADLARFTREREQARNALAVLIGQPLPLDLPAPLPFAALDHVQEIPVGLPSDLLERRPDIRAAQNNLLAANANIGAAKAAFFPSISLTGSVGTASTSLGDLFAAGTGAWAFTPSVSLPIFRGGSLQAGLEQANAAQRGAVAAYQQSVQQAFREVSDALAGEATFASQLQARSAQSSSAQRYFDLSNARFFNGIDSFLDVQVAQVELFNSRLQEVQTGFELLANRVNLYKALGGGWDESVAGATRVQFGAATQSVTESPAISTPPTPPTPSTLTTSMTTAATVK